MTRSGVFNSVHSFTQSAIGPTILVFLAAGARLLASCCSRSASTRSRPRAASKPRLSREAMFLLNNLLFVLLHLHGARSAPCSRWWSRRCSGVQMSVGRPYFDRMAVPIGAALLFLMGVGPALPWGRATPASRCAARCCRRSAGAASLVAAVGFAAGRAQRRGRSVTLALRRLHRLGDACARCGCRCASACAARGEGVRPGPRRGAATAAAAGASPPTSCTRAPCVVIVAIAVSSTMGVSTRGAAARAARR